MKKLFTLIELIVVIVVIGVLAAIVIPNISSWQQEANNTAITSNVRNLQISVDMYTLKNNGKFPIEGVTEFEPKPIDFSKLNPEQLRNLPKTKGVLYWIDAWGIVWGSHVDSPEIISTANGRLVWKQVEGASRYKIYEVVGYKGNENIITARLVSTKLKLVDETVSLESNVVELNKAYVVSAIDDQGFETAPVGSVYEGYDSYTLVNNQEDVSKKIDYTYPLNGTTISNYQHSFTNTQFSLIQYQNNTVVEHTPLLYKPVFIDLGQEQFVSGINLSIKGLDGQYKGEYADYDYLLEASYDNVNWFTVRDDEMYYLTSNKNIFNGWERQNFQPVKARYWKMTQKRNYQSNGRSLPFQWYFEGVRANEVTYKYPIDSITLNNIRSELKPEQISIVSYNGKNIIEHSPILSKPIIVDLGKEDFISGINLSIKGLDGQYKGEYADYDYRLEGSIDGQNWFTIRQDEMYYLTSNKKIIDGWENQSFRSVKVRYLKMTQTRDYQSNGRNLPFQWYFETLLIK